MFGSVDMSVRPIRLAHLVDPGNVGQIREAIRLSSTLWGGAHFPIIPLYQRAPDNWRDTPFKFRGPAAKTVISGYIDAFDPDILVQFSRNVPDFVSQRGLKIIEPSKVWEPFRAWGGTSPQFGLGIFELFDDVFEEHFKYKAKYPVKIVVPNAPKAHSLFWASLFGEFPQEIAPFLDKKYAEPLEIETADFRPHKLRDIMAADVLFPRRVISRRLKFFRNGWVRNEGSLFFLDATNAGDIVDFWNLRALGRPVLPVPKQMKHDAQLSELVIAFLKFHRRPWPHDPKVCDHASIIKSRSCSMEELQEYARTLRIDREPGDPSDYPFFALQHWYPRAWDEWARETPDDIYGEEEVSLDVADVKDLSVRIKALLPQFAQKHVSHGQPRCANEISFRFYRSGELFAEVFPRSSLKTSVSAFLGRPIFRGNWRVGKNGLVKLVTHTISEVGPIPEADKVVFSWLADLGWKPALSAAGLLARQIYRQLEGNLALLAREQLLGLLEHMNGGRVKRNGRPADENKIGQERDLPVGQVKDDLGGIYDYLLSIKAFKLGLRIKCPHCIRHSWFSLANVADVFTCPKCLNEFPAVGNIGISDWTYKTAGPFSVPNYAEGAYSVLLTLDFFDEFKMSTMRTTPVLSFTATAPDKQNLEADLALFWQEQLYGRKIDGLLFAECKTYGQFRRKDLLRMQYLAKTFPGAVLAFSTLRKSLTANEVAGIRRIAKAGRRYWKPERPINPVLILTGTELLGFHGPPYCWEGSAGQKFSRVQGLLDVCDATQQMYLNLPPLQTEWHEAWEKKRRRRLARMSQQPSHP